MKILDAAIENVKESLSDDNLVNLQGKAMNAAVMSVASMALLGGLRIVAPSVVSMLGGSPLEDSKEASE